MTEEYNDVVTTSGIFIKWKKKKFSIKRRQGIPRIIHLVKK